MSVKLKQSAVTAAEAVQEAVVTFGLANGRKIDRCVVGP
jgi:hypothetical protein